MVLRGKKNLILISCVLVTFLFGSCLPRSADSGKEASGSDLSPNRVHFACWGNTVSQDILDDFKKETGIEVRLSLYSSNEELLAKLQAGASGYDLAVPSDYMVGIMRSLNLLEPLDHSRLTQLKALDRRFLNLPFDPGNEYSVPLGWGTTGIAINRDRTSKKIRSWKDVFEDPELQGKFTLLDDVRETLGMALKYNGFSLNSQSESELKKAQQTLIQIKAHVKAFTSDPLSGIASGEFAVSHMYSSDAYNARKRSAQKVEYVIPAEGATLWIDSLVIPRGARNKGGALRLIDYLISARVGLKNFERMFSAPARRDVIEQLPPFLRNDLSLFPSDFSKLERIQDIGESIAHWDRLWTEVKVQN